MDLRSPHLVQRAVQRLSALGNLAVEDLRAIEEAGRCATPISAGRDIQTVFDPRGRTLLVLDGWLARCRLMKDGRRQIVSIYLPGEVLQTSSLSGSVLQTSVVTLSASVVAPAPESERLAEAYSSLSELEFGYLCRQVVRLGRMNSFEKMRDWMHEVRDRLEPVELADSSGFQLPITQEMLADVLGLTAVHVNRTLKMLREAKVAVWRMGKMRFLLDPAPARNAAKPVGATTI